MSDDAPSSDEANRLDFVSGQVHALIGLMLVMARAHPHPAALLQQLDVMELAATARAESEPVSDTFLGGLRDPIGRVRQAVRRQLGLPTDQNNKDQKP